MSDGSQDVAERVEAGAGPRFRLPIYEGPLDLLLHLIKRAELDARDVTASVITEQYLAYLELLDSLNLDVAGEYLVMAATLLLIKSFGLLPHPGNEDLEEAGTHSSSGNGDARRVNQRRRGDLDHHPHVDPVR